MIKCPLSFMVVAQGTETKASAKNSAGPISPQEKTIKNKQTNKQKPFFFFILVGKAREKLLEWLLHFNDLSL